MKSYRPQQSRAAFGAAAAIVTLLNFAVLVVLPSKTEGDGAVFAARVQARTAALVRWVAPALHFGATKQKKHDEVPPKFS